MERIPTITNPVFFDKAVAEIQNILGTKLPWLNHVFGICERNTRVIDGKRYNIATVYTGKDNYEQIEPCSELGNFCFFVLHDPQDLLPNYGDRFSSPISVIFWYDMRTASNAADTRNREEVKTAIVKALSGISLRNGTFEFSRVYEQPENVFRDFSYDYVDNQFLMSPYAGVRVDGVLYADVPCN